MHRHLTMVFAVTRLSTSGLLLGTCAARTPPAAPGAASSPAVDSVAAKLVELELQRIAARTDSPTPSAGQRAANAHIAALHQRLSELPDRSSAERIVAQRVLLALDARKATLESRLQELRMVYTDEYPTVRTALEEERLVDQRRAEIRSAALDNRDNGAGSSR